MRNLNPPSLPDLHVIDVIVATPQTPVTTKRDLRRMRQVLRTAAAAYRPNLLGRRVITPLATPTPDIERLKAAYKTAQSETHHSMLQSSVLLNPENRGGLCVYCDISVAHEMDHFLPKSVFPEFAVLSANLVPSCGRCNRLKGESAFQPSGARYFHSYLDSVDFQFVRAALHMADGALYCVFELDIPSPTCPVIAEGIELEFDELQLISRYQTAANLEMGEQLVSVMDYLTGPLDRLSKSFESNARHLLSIYGVNHWKSLLYAAIVDVGPGSKDCIPG